MVRAEDRSLRGTLRPVRGEPGVLRFRLRVRVPEHGDPAVAPLTARVHTADAVREGALVDCRSHGRRRTKLTWD